MRLRSPAIFLISASAEQVFSDPARRRTLFSGRQSGTSDRCTEAPSPTVTGRAKGASTTTPTLLASARARRVAMGRPNTCSSDLVTPSNRSTRPARSSRRLPVPADPVRPRLHDAHIRGRRGPGLQGGRRCQRGGVLRGEPHETVRQPRAPSPQPISGVLGEKARGAALRASLTAGPRAGRWTDVCLAKKAGTRISGCAARPAAFGLPV